MALSEPDIYNRRGYTADSAADLIQLAVNVNGGIHADKHFELANDIDLNPGVTFTFDPDTGLVTAQKGAACFFLGTGITGDDSGDNEVFDAIASTRGTIYGSNFDTAPGTDTIGLNLWTPIGTNAIPFNGSFDGNDNIISGIYVNTTSGYQGFIGSMGSTGNVRNIGVENSYIKGSGYQGGIAGYSRGSITNSYNTGIVIATGIYVGGITGFNHYGKLANCYNAGVVSSENNFVGGITGQTSTTNATTINCYNTGRIHGNNWVGGIGGYITGTGIVQYCYNGGVVTGVVTGSSSHIGDIVGENWGGVVEGCGTLDSNQKVIAGTESNSGIEQTLLAGLTSGASTLLEELNAWVTSPTLPSPPALCDWKEDSININGGYPLLAYGSELPITISAIDGIAIPVSGEAPTTANPDTAEYTAVISWFPADAAFQSGTIYSATITITPKTGYTTEGVPQIETLSLYIMILNCSFCINF